MKVWRLGGKIIRTVAVLCTTVVHNDFVFVCLYRFSILYVFCVSLDQFIPVLLAFVVLGLASSVPSQEVGREERLRSDLFYVE